jgi:hypothetical protein
MFEMLQGTSVRLVGSYADYAASIKKKQKEEPQTKC